MAKKYKCPFCQKEFDSKNGLKVHIGKVHKKEKEKVSKAIEKMKADASKVTAETHEIINIFAFNEKENKMKELWILKLNRDELKENGFKIPLIVKAKNETKK